MTKFERLREKIWRIPDGFPFKRGNMIVRMDEGKLLITGWVSAISFSSISRADAQNQLKRLKESYLELSNAFPELKAIKDSNNLEVEYHITYDDAGKAGIGLCSEINNALHWYI